RAALPIWVTRVTLEVWPSGPVYHNGGTVPRDFRGMTIFTGGQLNLIHIRADLFHGVHNRIMVLDVSLRTLNRLSWQFNIPISHPVAPSNQRASIPSPSC